jgi:sialate O-acetylesterase
MRKLICAIVALMGITASAKVRLPQFFSDNMVLQQQTECYLWG